MWRLGLLIVSLLIMPMAIAMACDFQYDPVSTPTYYRPNGWTLPGTTDFNPSATPQMYGGPKLTKIPGAHVQLLSHDDDPYIIEFPLRSSF